MKKITKKFRKHASKKTAAIITIVALMLSCVSPVFAFTYVQPVVADLFKTFNGAQTADDAFGDAEFLGGKGNVGFYGDETGTVASFADSVNVAFPFDEVIKTGIVHMGFDYKNENQTDGGMYVRAVTNQNFPDNVGYRYVFGTSQDGTNQYNEQWVGILNINGTVDPRPNKVAYPLTFCGFEAPKFTKDTLAVTDLDTNWHRYDIYINYGAMGMWCSYYYCDGEFVGQGNSNFGYSGLKSIGFTGGKGDKMDNLVIEHYPNIAEGATADKPYVGHSTKMVADYALGGVQKSGGKVSVSFSEPVTLFANGSDAEESDFVITDTSGNEMVNSITAVATDTNKITLTLGSLDPGVYNVGVASESADMFYKGMISGTTVSNTAKFLVSGGTIDGSSRRYYMDEDFDDYAGGMPNGFVKSSDLSYNGDYANLSSDNGKSGKALALNGAESVSYEFPYAIKDGSFTIEFDMFSDTGASWSVGLPKASAFESDEWKLSNGFDSGTNTTKWKNIDRNNGYLLGHTHNSYSVKLNDVQYAVWYQNAPTYTKYTNSDETETEAPSVIDGLLVNENQWNNFKIDVDLNAGTASVRLNDGEAKSIVFNTSRFASELLGKEGTNGVVGDTFSDRKVLTGVGGIQLSANKFGESGFGTTKVMYDNVKVYTQNSANAQNDFNTWAKDRAVEHGGWVEIDNEIAPVRKTNHVYGSAMQNSDVTSSFITDKKTMSPMSRIGGVAGNTGSDTATDTALMYKTMTTPNAHAIHNIFNVPIKAGRSFDIEFDLKLPADDNGFALGVLNKNNMYGVGYTSSGIAVSDGGANSLGTAILTNLINASAQNKLIAKDGMVIQNNNGEHKSPGNLFFAKGGTDLWGTGQVSEVVDSSDQSIKATLDKWQRYKLTYTVRSGNENPYLTLTVWDIDESGNTVEDSMRVSTEYQAKGIKVSDDITGLSLLTYAADATNGSSFAIDNLKVTEIGVVSENYVISTNAKKNDGTSEKADTQVSSAIEAIEIELAKAIESAESVRVVTSIKNGDAYTEADAQLSADGKSILVPITSGMLEASNGNDFDITIGLPATLASKDSYTDIFKPQTFKYTVKAEDGKVVIDSFRLYKKFEKTTYSPEGWYPVSSQIKDTDTSSVYKMIAKGYNTGNGSEVVLIRSSEDASELLTAGVSKSTISDKGTVYLESEEFSINGSESFVNGFVWEELKPLAKQIQMDIKKTK